MTLLYEKNRCNYVRFYHPDSGMCHWVPKNGPYVELIFKKFENTWIPNLLKIFNYFTLKKKELGQEIIASLDFYSMPSHCHSIHDMHYCNVFNRPNSWLVVSDVKISQSLATNQPLDPWQWCISVDSEKESQKHKLYPIFCIKSVNGIFFSHRHQCDMCFLSDINIPCSNFLRIIIITFITIHVSDQKMIMISSEERRRIISSKEFMQSKQLGVITGKHTRIIG